MENTNSNSSPEAPASILVLGIDQSLTNTGVCEMLYRPGMSIDAPEVKTYTLSPKLTGAERLNWFYDWASSAMARASLIVMEGYSFGSQNNREVMGELGGVLKIAAYQQGKQLIISPPWCIKNFALPSSRQKMQGKEQMMQAARDTFGIALPLKKHEHEADAAHLAHLGLYYATGQDSPYPRRQASLQQVRDSELSKAGQGNSGGGCHVDMTSAAAPISETVSVNAVAKPVAKEVRPVVKRGVRG